MDEAEYPGVRAMLEAQLDTMKTPLKIDISTGDVITPGEIRFEYKRTAKIQRSTLKAEKTLIFVVTGGSAAQSSIDDFGDTFVYHFIVLFITRIYNRTEN